MSIGQHPSTDNYDHLYSADDFVAVEKIRSNRDGSMPVNNAKSEIRGRHRSKASQRRPANRPGGMHQRRIRKMD